MSGIVNSTDSQRVLRKPAWGTCAGLILLSEAANRTKKGGQQLIGGLDVRVNRNYFGRQVESFEADLDLPFLYRDADEPKQSFHSVFIRAPVVEKILPRVDGIQVSQSAQQETVVAPARTPKDAAARRQMRDEVEILARLPGRAQALGEKGLIAADVGEEGDIIAVRQGNCFGTSFHPELTNDYRIHVWWLEQVSQIVQRGRLPN